MFMTLGEKSTEYIYESLLISYNSFKNLEQHFVGATDEKIKSFQNSVYSLVHLQNHSPG